MTGGGGHVGRRGARRAVVAAIVAALAGGACRGRAHEAAPLVPLEGVEIAGCGDVVAGPVCRVGAERSLRVALPATATEVAIASDAGATPVRASVRGAQGTLITVDVPPGATRLEVTARVNGARAQAVVRLADRPAPVAWIEAARRTHRAGDAAEALRMLDRGEREADASDGRIAAEVASFRARAALAAGDAAGAAEGLERSADRHAALGELSAAADDESARTHVLIEESLRFADARASIARTAAWSRDYPDGAVLAAFHEGQLALATGDLRAGLASLDEVRAHGERIGSVDIVRTSEGLRALALLRVGRVDEAHAIFEGLERTGAGDTPPCERASIHVNLGWAALVARDAPTAPAIVADPRPPLRQAEEAYRTTCLDPQARANVLSNLAWADLQDGDLPGARARLAEARDATHDLDLPVALFALDLEGRVALAAGDARRALAVYGSIAAHAAGASPSDEARAAEGRSEALARLGDRAGALAALDGADAILAKVASSVPLGEGRGAFWWTRERVTRRRVELLVDAGRAAEALDAVRSARARIHEDVQRVAHGSSLAPDVRARWEDALAEYGRGREALVTRSREDWSLSEEALARATASRHARDVDLRARLDAVARDVFPTAPGPRAPLAIDEGTIALAWTPLATRPPTWAAFRVARGEVHVARVAAPTDAAHVTDAAARLVASEAGALRAAKRLRWLATDALRDLDVHVLTLDGAPLLAHLPVEYVVDLAGGPPPLAPGPTVVVADPGGTLPGARTEGLALAAALDAGPATHLLVGADATRARVLAELPLAGAFHFSGHASYAGVDGWDSALRLADDGLVSVADVLALRHGPALVVLSGCETGRGGAYAGAPGLGLAEAFAVAGARTVIATQRPVRDEDAERILRALTSSFASLSVTTDPAGALRDAELALRREAPSADWSAFRALVR